MNKAFVPLILIAVLCQFSCRDSSRLFNGKGGNWIIRGNAQWNFANNEFEGICKETEGFVMTKEKYADFELQLEFYPDSSINSGVFVRCQDFKLSATECHEMNIWDLHHNQEFRTGSIVTKSIPLVKVNTLNKWNSYRIKCKKEKVGVWVNDTLTAMFEDFEMKSGYIGLQASGNGKIKFRNVHLKPL